MRRKDPVALAVAVLLFAGGCGGDGGGELDLTQFQGHLVAVSFVGYLPVPGVGPNPLATLPTVFRDQALELTFDKPLDDGILGGFLTQGGVPVELLGIPAAGTQGIPYLPYADQEGARGSLQIRRNFIGGPPLFPYVVGRHRDKPDTVVVDPRVPPDNPFGLPASAGFAPNAEYVVIIPAENGFRFGGFPAAPFGADVADLPIVIPSYTTQPELSRLFRTGIAFGPDPVPPEVVAIDAVSLTAGTAADPIGASDPIIVTFSKPVTSQSIDQLKNFIVRNVDVPTFSAPGGVLVPGAIAPLTPGATADSIWLFTPAAPYGPGVSPSEGFDIEVRIGDIPYPQPNSFVPPILGVPMGLSGTQLELSNSLSRIMRSTPCVGCQTPASITEGFDDSFQKDPTFVQSFGAQQARWNDPAAPSHLAGRFTSGSPLGNSPASLGTRIQFTVTPPELIVYSLFSPFDASLAQSGNQCPGSPTGCNLGINPNGGSHIMHIYEAVELGNTEDSLEQIEWSPFGGVTAPTVYPQYQIWCGVSNVWAPIGGGPGGGPGGLNSVFEANYNLIPYQANTPAAVPILPMCNPTTPNAKKIAGGGPTSYVVALQTSQFYPFPLLNPCFDYARDTGVSGAGVNLLFEQNIEPGNQVPNFNRFRAPGFTPVRRLIDAPLSLNPPNICPFNHGGTFDIYHARFTFVGIVGQARSLWYDTGSANPTYLDFIVSPGIYFQPPGTQSTWILEGTDAPNPGPGTVGASAVYISANGTVNPSVLTVELLQKRYFRFKVELRGNNVTNTTPAYTGVQMAYSIP